MGMGIGFVAKKEESGLPLLSFLASHLPSLTLEEIRLSMNQGRILLNGALSSEREPVREGDAVLCSFEGPLAEKARKDPGLGLRDSFSSFLVYEDGNILIANKPKGVLVQRLLEHGPSLLSWAQDYLKNKGGDASLSPAHRLDRATSGCVIFGKNGASLSVLGKALMKRQGIAKKYWALVYGKTDERGLIEEPLRKDPKTGVVAPCPIADGGKASSTEYRTLERFGWCSLLEVALHSGRTHQIRAHMLSIGHPVVGDQKYGKTENNAALAEEFGLEGQFLHAHSVSFGRIGEPLNYLAGKTFLAPLPDVEEKMLKRLRASAAPAR